MNKNNILKDLYTQLRKHVPPEKFSELQQLLRRLKSSSEGVNIQQAVLGEMCNIAGKDLIKRLLIQIKAGKSEQTNPRSTTPHEFSPRQPNDNTRKPCGCSVSPIPLCSCGCTPHYDITCDSCGRGLVPSLEYLLACKNFQ